MKYTVVITNIGNSYGFVIAEQMVRDLNIKLNDRIKFTIFQILRNGISQDIQVFIKGHLITSGGKYGGFIIKKKLLIQLNIEVGTVLNIELEKEK